MIETLPMMRVPHARPAVEPSAPAGMRQHA